MYEPNRGGSIGLWSIRFLHWVFRGEGRLSSVGVEVSGRKPHGSSAVPWKATNTPCVLFPHPARSGFVSGSKKGQILLSLEALNAVHLHHCFVCTAVD